MKAIPKQTLGDNDRGFLERVFFGGLTRYGRRINAIGLVGLGDVLDAGCGFGQWSLTLSQHNTTVHAYDYDEVRLRVLNELAQATGTNNVITQSGSVEVLPYADASMDGIFCYSVLIMVDWKRAIKEFHRVLRPGGLLYIGANDLGWYLRLYDMNQNAKEDYDPQMVAVNAMRDTLIYKRTGEIPQGSNIIIESKELVYELASAGFSVETVGGDGEIERAGDRACLVESLLPGSYRGITACYEVVAKKIGDIKRRKSRNV